MQPTTPRPVMDVKPRKPAATTPASASTADILATATDAQPASQSDAAPPLAVHQAPANDTEAPSKQPTSSLDEKSKTSSQGSANTVEPEQARPISPKPKNLNPAPVGAIVGAIVVMIALSAIAIAMYLKA